MFSMAGLGGFMGGGAPLRCDDACIACNLNPREALSRGELLQGTGDLGVGAEPARLCDSAAAECSVVSFATVLHPDRLV